MRNWALAFALTGSCLFGGAVGYHVAPGRGVNSLGSTAVDEALLPRVTHVVTLTRTNILPVARFPADTNLVEQLMVENNQLLARLGAAERALSRAAVPIHVEEREEQPVRQNWQERIDRLREENPERFAEIETQRTAFRDQMKTVVDDRIGFLKDLDVTLMTEDERAAHQELIQRIEQTWEVFEGFNEGRFPDAETRNQLRENFFVIRELYDVQRDYVLRQVGSSLGFDAKDAEDFSGYMSEIFELTSPQLPRGMGLPGMGRRGRGGDRE